MACSTISLAFWIVTLVNIPSIFAGRPYHQGLEADTVSMVVMYGFFGPLAALAPWFKTDARRFFTARSVRRRLHKASGQALSSLRLAISTVKNRLVAFVLGISKTRLLLYVRTKCRSQR